MCTSPPASLVTLQRSTHERGAIATKSTSRRPVRLWTALVMQSTVAVPVPAVEEAALGHEGHASAGQRRDLARPGSAEHDRGPQSPWSCDARRHRPAAGAGDPLAWCPRRGGSPLEAGGPDGRLRRLAHRMGERGEGGAARPWRLQRGGQRRGRLAGGGGSAAGGLGPVVAGAPRAARRHDAHLRGGARARRHLRVRLREKRPAASPPRRPPAAAGRTRPGRAPAPTRSPRRRTRATSQDRRPGAPRPTGRRQSGSACPARRRSRGPGRSALRARAGSAGPPR